MAPAFPLPINHNASDAEIIPASYFAPLDLEAIFPQDAPLKADLGGGNGAFLVEIAALRPERNFVGVERLPGRGAPAAPARNVFLPTFIEHLSSKVGFPSRPISAIILWKSSAWRSRPGNFTRL